MDNLVQLVLAIGTLSALVAAGSNALKLRQQAADESAQNALARMNEVVSRIEDRNEKLSARVTQLEAREEALRAQLAARDEQIARMSLKIERLQEGVIARDEQIAGMHAEIEQLRESNVDLQAQLNRKRKC